MDAHLSWDALYPLMEEVKALARGLLHHEHQASLQTQLIAEITERKQAEAERQVRQDHPGDCVTRLPARQQHAMELAMEALEGDADPLPGRPRIGYQPLEGHPTHLALGPEGAPSGDAQKGMLAQPRDAPQQPAGIQTLSGQPLEARYIVLQGQLRVSMALEESLELAQIQAGGISFVDSRPPTATVTASTDALVLAIFRQRLTAKLAQDEGFVARCYHALAVVLADRIRSTVLRLASRSRDRLADARDVEEELDPRSCSAWPWPEPALTECGSGYRVPHG